LLIGNKSREAGLALSERRLAYLAAVADAKSIRGAADDLEIESSVVSRQIQLLERELNTTLLHRRARGVAATDAGQLILEYHRRRLHDQAAMLSKLDELKWLQRGNVHIAASEGFIEPLVKKVLPAFGQKCAQIEITLNTMPASAIVQMVANGRVNIGLAFAPALTDNVRVFARKRHPLFIIARHDHPIARHSVLPDMESLTDLPFCLVPEEFGIGQLTRLAEESTQVSLSRAMMTNSLQALRGFVLSGLGLTILPKILVRQELDAGTVKAIHVKNILLEAAEAQIIIPTRPFKSTTGQAILQSVATLNWFT
jgi:DNA-binding transcriptional LysR family regulator